MNYIKHLTGFFEKVANDKALNPTHVSLYIALFQFWNYSRFKNPISISRDEVMRISKISSKATYHKCLKALHSLGYIKYEPSYNPFKGSHVFLFNFSDDLKPSPKSERTASPIFEPVGEQVLNKSQAGTEKGSGQVDEQAVVPYINTINNINDQNVTNGLNLVEPEKNENSDLGLKDEGNQEEEKSSAKKEEEKEMPVQWHHSDLEIQSPAFADYSAERTATSRQKSSAKKEKVSPTIEEVLNYFHEQDYPETEANKFFNYFQSIGWLVGGKTPMTDWQAAARNWMLNAPKYTSNERAEGSRHFDTSTAKDYGEAL
jgi:hypothetical protein